MVEGGDVFYESVQEMASDHNFLNTISRLPESAQEKRADEELVLRYFAVTTFRRGYKGNIEEWLDSYMEGVLFGEIEFDVEAMKSDFVSVFSLINEKLGDQAFTRFNEYGNATGRLAPAYFEAVVASFFEERHYLASLTDSVALERLKAAFASAKFKDATGPGANTIPKLQLRIDAVKEHLVL